MRIECVYFDMDGTLIGNTDSVRYLCELNGNLDALEEIEGLENEGEISWIEADHLKAPLIAGLDTAKVECEFERSIDLIRSIDAVLSYLKEKQILSVLITAGPVQVAEIIGSRFGFDAFYGSEYEVAGARFSGRITKHLGNDGKLDSLKEFCSENGVSLDHCVAIGDSESDVDVFRACGKAIAINYSEAAAEVASERIVTEDLADVLGVLEAWLSE